MVPTKNSFSNLTVWNQTIESYLMLLKLIPGLILIPLYNIINVSFNTRVFPSLLKIVKVIPIHKGGSTQDMNKYRPISLLFIFEKIIETCA